MKKALAFALALVLSFAMAACGKKDVAVPHYDNMGDDYNKSLFYRNDLTAEAADPSVIYVEKDKTFYMYATSDEIGAAGFLCKKSKNLSDWETAGAAFVPDRRSWANRNYWAPEVIEIGGKYYMYYNAMDRYNNDIQSIGVAVADAPEGPFVQWTGKNLDGRDVGLTTPLIDFRFMPNDHPLYADNDGIEGFQPGQIKAIDASPFVDDDGKMYMYFCHDLGSGFSKSEIWGMEMKDPVTPDYTTVTRLTETNLATVGGEAIDTESSANKVNEAPFMCKREGKYYLTYSVNSYWEKGYAVAQAVGEAPLGGFTKVPLRDGGLLLSAGGDWDHASGTGHHSVVKVGNEHMIFYHAHLDRVSGGGARAVACDRLSVRGSGSGRVLYALGPTWSVQPLPADVSGYTNLAPRATVTGGGDPAALTDGLVSIHDFDGIGESVFENGGTIEVRFETPVTVRAILVYNSREYDNSFVKIDRIEMTYTDGKNTETGVIDGLGFNWNRYKAEDADAMRPGGASAAEFDDARVTNIKITLPAGVESAVSEIVILGKEA